MKNKFVLAAALLGLQSCAGSNIGSSWNCATPSVDGKACLNITEADARTREQIDTGPRKVSEEVLVVKLGIAVPDQEPMPYRTSERVARIWFAPFIDKYSNRHEDSLVHFVDQDSNWRR